MGDSCAHLVGEELVENVDGLELRWIVDFEFCIVCGMWNPRFSWRCFVGKAPVEVAEIVALVQLGVLGGLVGDCKLWLVVRGLAVGIAAGVETSRENVVGV